jgi:hypothetical protein
MTFITSTTWSSHHRELIASLATQSITPSVILSLRKRFGEAQGRQLIELASLQPKAVKKFGPGVWMATSRALEQSTDHVVASYKASMMADWDVLDLCGGIGGDAMGFAARGGVLTIDRDPIMTKMAAENLRTSRATRAVAICDDVQAYVDRLGSSANRCSVHVDPDRRPDERRTVDPASYSPSLERVNHWASSMRACLVKLAPAAELPDEIAGHYHRQWISHAGSVREQMLVSGDCLSTAGLRAGERSAVRLMSDGSHCLFSSVNFDVTSDEAAHSPLEYLYDFDGSVRAAGLSMAFAQSHGLKPLSGPAGFFTSDDARGYSPLLQGFRVEWSGPADIKQVRKQLAVLGGSLRAIKVRGSDHDPQKLQKSLAVDSPSERIPMTLLIGRGPRGVWASLATSLGIES